MTCREASLLMQDWPGVQSNHDTKQRNMSLTQACICVTISCTVQCQQ
jgi:hypothetical protein